MKRLWTFLTDIRVLSLLGLLALVAFLFLGADVLKIGLIYAALIVAGLLLLWLVIWLARKQKARREARALEEAIAKPPAESAASGKSRPEVDALRKKLEEAVRTIKTSKLGQLSGSAALYELPWYMIIGNPAAGKSTAIVKSGLQFPFADNTANIIQGIGGTRHCDWFFTNEGILLDTAGRYSVHEEDRDEWLAFLKMLKRHRPKAPINGIVIAASVPELAGGRPEAAIQLAKSLRQRVQELTESLEVFAPVYLVFTKADLIAGFAEFFEDRDRTEREQVWGATLPYDTQAGATARADAVAAFETRFDELVDGLREMSMARMSMYRGQTLPPGVLTFPLEFSAMKPALAAFVATLFEDNPYQFRPIFRGFYFTSAVQEGSATSRAADRIAQQFGLDRKHEMTTAVVYSEHGFFLKNLFSRVVFADRNLVKQYTSRAKLRWRLASFALALAVLGVGLGGWTWSALGNRQLLANVRADLDKAVKLQQDKTDLASRMEAMEVLQDRIEQLQAYRDGAPLGLSLGLYQGDTIEQRLREEYFAGLKQVMLQPVAQGLETFLGEVNANAARLQPMARPPESGAAPGTGAVPTAAEQDARLKKQAARFDDAAPDNVEDAYNALKTYLMLGDKARMESGHLTDQITRFWRGWLEANRGSMPREQMIRSAERMLSFAMAHLNDAAYPLMASNYGVVDATRENLRRVVRGMPARERVYADIKARAATRFAPMTVARITGDADREVIAGSYAIAGTFTREAWDNYVKEAFKDAAHKELQSSDWVLKTATRDDLTLEGSPEQIEKVLVDLYKTEYVREWQRFMQGIAVAEFANFEQAVTRMNRLGDPAASPIKRVMDTLFDNTSWDNPTLLNERLAQTQRGFVDWFKQTVLRQSPAQVQVNVSLGSAERQVPLGPIGREFAALSRLMLARDNSPTLMAGYLQQLSKVRTRFNQMKTQGDPGPASRQLLATTFEGGESELSDSLRFVDEQMLVGMPPTARETLRPLLVRPLMQAFGVVVPPAETELNRIWVAQVFEPFQRTLAGKYPFDPASRVEAGPQEIGKIFGPNGAIAKYATDTLAPLVVRRGDAVSPKTWADAGLRLRPDFSTGFATWVATQDGGGSAGATGGAAAPDQERYQLQPRPAPGLTEFTVVIDGQTLRYRNEAPTWTDFVRPSGSGVPGAEVRGVTFDGRTVEFVNEPGAEGFNRMIDKAQLKKLGQGLNELTWTQGSLSVSVLARVIRQQGSVNAAPGGGGSGLKGVKLPPVIAGADTPVLPGNAGAAASAAASGATR